MNELIRPSATTLARRIRDREVSSLEVVEAHLRRIEAVNPALNAVVCLAADGALAGAHAADAMLARGAPVGPLHGVPVTIKDSLPTAGMRSTAGTLGLRDHVPETDATVVARLTEAGAILLGKTNTPELTLAFETDNLVYGQTRNPYDASRSPGGSSGGAAAIIASAGSPLDLGTDTGGSIRLPAHWCGIAGLRPTSGRVPRTGHLLPPGGHDDALTTIGPMARYVEDLALALPLIAGPDGRDPAIAPAPLGDPSAISLASLRVAWFLDNGIVAPTPETAATVEAAVACLAAAGATVREARPEPVPETYEVINAVWAADGGAGVRALLRSLGTERAHRLTERTQEILSPYAAATPAAFAETIVRWDAFRGRMLAFMDDYDLIVCPACAVPALPVGAAPDHDADFSYTMTHNLTGWPAVVVRAGTSVENLPIGVQLVARPWREDVPLAAAARIEVDLGGWQPPPIECEGS